MKKAVISAFMLIVWMFFTLILLCTVIGGFLFLSSIDNDPSTWMRLGRDLKDAFIKNVTEA